MLSTAPKADRTALRDAEAVVLPITRAAGSAFAPSGELLAAFTGGHIGWRQFERRYTEEMRARYRADPQLWIDLVEQAASDVGDVVLVCDECGPERPGAGEALARCHRRLLQEFLLAVARGRGLVVDPDTDELDRTLLEARRKAVLAAEGFPLICSVCGRPAGTARAIRGRDGYGYCSEACLEADVARWKAQLWSAGSGRRP
jgi:uncharacterized protein YeaO (DUF488 family)